MLTRPVETSGLFRLAVRLMQAASASDVYALSVLISII